MIERIKSTRSLAPGDNPRAGKKRPHPKPSSLANLIPGGTKKRNKDPNRNKPANWNNRHELILYMYTAGQRNIDIAKALNYAPERVSAIVNSPLFQQQHERLLEELRGQTLDNLIDAIRKDAPKNFQALVELRDVFERNGGDAKIRLGAMRQISREQDRVWPRKTEHTEEKTIRLVFDQHTMAKMAQALGDAREIDIFEADFQEIADDTEPGTLLNPKGVDDLIEELASRADDESSDS